MFGDTLMPAVRKPTNVLKLTGAYEQSPSRKHDRDYEPEGAEFPKRPPKNFSSDEKAMWEELVESVPPGVLQFQDKYIVEKLAVSFNQFRKHKAHTKPNIMAEIRHCLGQLGMTPADRSRIISSRKKNGNKFED